MNRRIQTKCLCTALLLGGLTWGAQAQKEGPAKMPPGSLELNIDSAVVTHHEVTIKGQKVPYTATTGTMPVWDEDGKPIAGVFLYLLRTFGYKRSDDKAPGHLL